MSSQNQKIEVRPGTLGNLLNDVESGRYRIPQFQREFVWPYTKVVELLDSIYREFPIGSFFLWKAPRDCNSLFRHTVGLGIPPVREDEDVSFILDGQQRITSLYVTLRGLRVNGNDYRSIVLDLQEEKFGRWTADNRRYVSVADIWGPNALSLSRGIDQVLQPAFDRCYQILRTYPISIVEVRDKGLTEVCKIFQRINQSGKRLDRFDLVAAMTFTPDFDLRERFKADVQAKLKQKGFGEIKSFVVTQLMALIKTGLCTERYEFDLTADDIRNHWKSTIESIFLAVETLRSNMGVARAEFLPYEAFITLLAYYFHKSGKRALPPEHLEWVKKWFWRASFAAHYGSGGPTKIGNDRKRFDDLIDGTTADFDIPLNLTVGDIVKMRMNLSGASLRNAFLCLLSLRGPLDLSNNSPLNLSEGGPISDFSNPEKHHIFPQGHLKRQGEDALAVQSLANFCFLTSELNKRVSDSDPAAYFPALRKDNPEFERAAAASILPTKPGCGIEDNNFVRFLQARGEMILEEVQRVCGTKISPREDERQRVIKAWEDRIRDLIHKKLAGAFGSDYWKQQIPSHIQDNVDRRLEPELKKLPEAKRAAYEDPRVRLDFCDVSEYPAIITAKPLWTLFADCFPKKPDLELYMGFFREYRNCTMHGRPMSDLIRSNGEAALVWLETVLPTNPDEEETEDGS